MREQRNAAEVPLSLDAAEFKAIGHALIERIGDFMESLPQRRVAAQARPDELRQLIGGDAPLPAEGRAAAQLVDAAASLLFDNSTFNAHPLFFGYITAPPAPIGVLGDLLAAAVNPNCGSAILAPMATEIEMQTVRWISELIGYRAGAGGLLVSGGNVANFTCLLAARAALGGDDLRRHGHNAALRIYTTTETHTWVQKAADLFGFGTDAIHWIDMDDRQRMRPDSLRAALEADARRGLRPVAVIATAGTVSTGVVDPIDAIADICAERGVWLHVDGAYGGFAAVVPGVGQGLDALHRADSVAVDPHKWLYAPLEAGCALVRDQEALRRAFAYHPPYYRFGIEATNYVDLGLQNSRGFRALKVWLALQHAGRRGYERMIADDIALAQHLHALVSSNAELEAFTCSLSISTFRYVPPALAARAGEPDVEELLNRINQDILDRLQAEGETFVSNAVIGGRYVLRACIVNFNTVRTDVEAVPGIVVRVGREVTEGLLEATVEPIG
jgi:aromatic-L-amino-acid/L-tryptophan decarboxylase